MKPGGAGAEHLLTVADKPDPSRIKSPKRQPRCGSYQWNWLWFKENGWFLFRSIKNIKYIFWNIQFTFPRPIFFTKFIFVLLAWNLLIRSRNDIVKSWNPNIKKEHMPRKNFKKGSKLLNNLMLAPDTNKNVRGALFPEKLERLISSERLCSE